MLQRRAERAVALRLWSGVALAWLGAMATAGCGDDAKPKTRPAEAVTCESDADCDGARCDPFVGCAECLFDGDCGTEARCVERACYALEACAKDDECEVGSCDADVGYCVDCRGDLDCGEEEWCVEGICAAHPTCEGDADCDAAERCDTKTSECVGCLTDKDCSADTACAEGRCVPHCSSNEDCPDVYYCKGELCRFDVCEAGRASCSTGDNAALLCTEAGDAFDLSLCGAGKSCGEVDGAAECQKWLCEPGKWLCDEGFEHAELCSADGRKVVQSVDCGETDEVCEAGECVAAVCEPGERRCDESGVATCSPSGGSMVVEPCGEGERCDSKTLECMTYVCEPGSGGCLAETVATCNDEGSALEVSGEDCAESEQACWEGACYPVACDGERQCIDGNSFQCAANRTKLELAQSCTVESAQFCNAESGQCQAFVCEPGLPTCNEDLATSCADDGSHPLDFGIDCTATQKVCWAAECLLPICDEGSYQCDDETLLRCANKGTALEVDQECGVDTVCDAQAGTCRLQKCVPNQPACDGDTATTCDDTGLGYTGDETDCSTDDEVCVSGACVPVICEPDAVYCAGDELRECNANGGAFELLDTCLVSEYCNAALSACVPDACAPGAPVCTGNVLGTCKQDGSGPEPGGSDCGDQVCDRGLCRDLICTPSAQFCDAGDVALCNAKGTSFAPYDNCRSPEYCAAAGQAASCLPDLCPQGASACSGEHLATCNDDGSAVGNVGVDCSATSKVCDLSGVCLAEALDDVGAAGSGLPFASSAIHFNLLRVLTARQVVELEAAAEPAASPVIWLVYRSDTELGTYQLVDQSSTAATVVDGYLSSGSVAFDLDAGAYYLIGLAVSGAHPTLVLENGAPAAVSFGVWLGGFSYTAGEPPTIPDEVQVGPGVVGDQLGLRVHSALP